MNNYEKEMKAAWSKFAETHSDASWQEIWEAAWKQSMELGQRQTEWQVGYWKSAFDKAMQFFTEKK